MKNCYLNHHFIISNQRVQAQRSVDISRSRLITMTGLLEYYLAAPNPLFDGFTTEPAKHSVIVELEKNLDGVRCVFKSGSITDSELLVDFMSLIRKINIYKMYILNNAVKAT